MFHVLDAINSAAKALLPVSTSQVHKQGADESVQEAAELTLSQVISVLTDLYSGINLETTASRRGVTAGSIRILIDAICSMVTKSIVEDSIVNPENLDDAQALAMALSITSNINIKFRRLSEPRWLHPRRLIASCSSAALQSMTSAWIALVQFGNINTPPNQASAKLVEGLHTIGIPVDRVVIRINPSTGDDTSTISRSTNFLKQHFQIHFGASPRFDITLESGVRGRVFLH